MKKATIFLAFIAFVINAKSQDTLVNSTIIKLHQAGFGKDVLKSKISNSPVRFDVSLDGMLELKKAGIPDDVINTMISKASEKQGAEPVSKEQQLEQGIYYISHTGEKLPLEPTIMAGARTSGLGSISGIFNSKVQSTLNGKEAAFRISDKNPTFLFVFDTTAMSDMNAGKRSFSNVRSPNEFLLVKLEAEKNSREIVISKGNNLKSSAGIDAKRIKLFTFKKLSKGVYELKPKEELDEGEYCFMFAEASHEGSANKVFDFSIKKSKGF